MATNPSKNISDDVQQQILDAASERFTQYGYNKTTMAEIAKDCGMSAANLYRHFENKLDIGANLACECLGNKTIGIHDIVQQKQQPASERLQNIVLSNLNYTYGQWSENPRMNEMVNAICGARMDIVDDYRLNEHALLVELLNDGISNGEFVIDDTEDTAYAITAAITMFNTPLLMSIYTLEEFTSKADSVVKLLLNGILKK
jgi:AcrR family transcriptional regulator